MADVFQLAASRNHGTAIAGKAFKEIEILFGKSQNLPKIDFLWRKPQPQATGSALEGNNVVGGGQLVDNLFHVVGGGLKVGCQFLHGT